MKIVNNILIGENNGLMRSFYIPELPFIQSIFIMIISYKRFQDTSPSRPNAKILLQNIFQIFNPIRT